MTTAKSSAGTQQAVELSPSYKLPLVLVVAAIPVLLVQPWVGGAIAAFGLFLMFQAATIRLKFTQTALDIYRSDKIIRHFPYTDWQNWQIFWNVVPILFYFKEVKSIHFLPVLFDPKMLRNALEQRVKVKEANQASV